MITKVVDVSAKTGKQIIGPVTSWQTFNGPYLVEHLAGQSPNKELTVFYWSPLHDWQYINVSRITKQRIASPVTSWVTENTEHLAGMAPNRDLIEFSWTPSQNWQAVNISRITKKKITGPVTSWTVLNGPSRVEHLAGMAPNGDLLVFYSMPGQNWKVVNVSKITKKKIAGPVTSWVAPNGSLLVEHLAGMAPNGDLLVFYWMPGQDWKVVNVTQITGQKIASPVTNWITGTAEHLAGQGPDNSLLVFWWSPTNNWRVINVSNITGEKIIGTPTPYQLSDGQTNVEILGARSTDGSLLMNWWTPSFDWQAMNLSDVTGHRIQSVPQAWSVPSGASKVEHLAAESDHHRLLVFWGDSELRKLTDDLSRPFLSLKRLRQKRKVVAILWDPHRPDHPSPTKESVEAAIFGPTNSVRDYFLENSNGYFTIENAGVLGWYPADKPASHYWGPIDTTDSNHDGWIHGHAEKWAEAIRKASADFNFKIHDTNPFDGNLLPEELGILIVIPQNGPFGTNRVAVGREYPQSEPLVVDGVTIGWISEAYIGAPPNVGMVAHELAHLLLGTPDMYFNIFMPYAAGTYSLMDAGNWPVPPAHLDPFAKLKLGWLRPKIIFRSGHYTLPNVEDHHFVWILMDPKRGTDEYFIIENRWPGSSYDKNLADAGLGIWHIIEKPQIYGSLPPPPGVSQTDWASIGAGDWGRRVIRMIRPVVGPPFDNCKALWNGSDPQTGYDLVSADPNPQHGTLRWADGTPSGFALRSISPAGPEMTVTIEVPF